MENTKRKPYKVSKFRVTKMPNGIIRAGTGASVATDRLRHGWSTLIKLCDMGNRQRLQLSS
jgi:hypothetical protein